MIEKAATYCCKYDLLKMRSMFLQNPYKKRRPREDKRRSRQDREKIKTRSRQDREKIKTRQDKEKNRRRLTLGHQLL